MFTIINTTLKIGITITWNFTLCYVIATISLWCWKRYHITMSLQSQYVIIIYHNVNPTKKQRCYNIACPVGWNYIKAMKLFNQHFRIIFYSLIYFCQQYLHLANILVVRNHEFSAYAKFCKKLIFLIDWYEHVRMPITGLEMLVFQKTCIRTKWMIANATFSTTSTRNKYKKKKIHHTSTTRPFKVISVNTVMKWCDEICHTHYMFIYTKHPK